MTTKSYLYLHCEQCGVEKILYYDEVPAPERVEEQTLWHHEHAGHECKVGITTNQATDEETETIIISADTVDSIQAGWREGYKEGRDDETVRVLKLLRQQLCHPDGDPIACQWLRATHCRLILETITLIETVNV